MSSKSDKFSLNARLPLNSNKKPNDYKSPHNSPVLIKKRTSSRGCIENALKENLNSNSFLKVSSKRKLSLQELDNKLLSQSGTDKENLDIKLVIEKLHPALIRNLSKKEPLEKNSKKTSEPPEKTKKKITLTEIEIKDLENHLASIQNSKNSEKLSRVLSLSRENHELTESIKHTRTLIENYKKTSVKPENFSESQKKLIDLDELKDSLILENIKLKQELSSQISSNSSSKTYKDHMSHINNLQNIHLQVSQLVSITKKYLSTHSLSISDFLSFDRPTEEISVPKLLEMTYKEVSKLKNLAHDIYAEKCGNECQNQ